MRRLLLAAALLSSSAYALPVNYLVNAFSNSINGGSGLATAALVSGEVYTITASPVDYWSQGVLPRWSNAAGLVTTLLEFGTDITGDSAGQAPGTVVGSAFGPYTLFGLTSPFGSLVGRIGSGAYFTIGLGGTFTATGSGVLSLYNWDNFPAADPAFQDSANRGNIRVTLNSLNSGVTVPEPAALGLLGVGLAMLGLARRRKA